MTKQEFFSRYDRTISAHEDCGNSDDVYCDLGDDLEMLIERYRVEEEADEV